MAGGNFARGDKAIAMCDRCGRQYKHKELKTIIYNQRDTNLRVCRECWEEDHPQLLIGTFRVIDNQALRNPRPDTTYQQSRNIQWGWNPVGLQDPFGLSGLEDMLEAKGAVGNVEVVTD